MKKIETLTEAQKAKFPDYIKKWISIGLSTENPDKSKAEAAIKKVYQCGGLKEPKTFIWVESPFHAGVCYALLKSGEIDKVIKQGASVGDSVRDSVRASCYGSHDANWLAFYKFMHDELKIDCSKLNGLWDAAKDCGWFIPFQNVVIVSPKPFQIRTKLNARGNHVLHADGEPAVFYCDDFKIYAREGIRLSEKYGSVKAENWKPEWFVEEKNVEIKRLIAEVLGYENLFEALNAKEISTHREYKLYRAENVDIEPMHILSMTCPSTKKTHYGRVPPEITNAREAATWRNHGIEPESFLIEQ